MIGPDIQQKVDILSAQICSGFLVESGKTMDTCRWTNVVQYPMEMGLMTLKTVEELQIRPFARCNAEQIATGVGANQAVICNLWTCISGFVVIRRKRLGVD